MSNQNLGFIINDDGSARFWIGDVMTVIDPEQWLNLCCTGAEYLGFGTREISLKRSEFDISEGEKE